MEATSRVRPAFRVVDDVVALTADAPALATSPSSHPHLARVGRLSVVAADALTVAAAMAITYWCRQALALGGSGGSGGYLRVGSLSIPVWLLVFSRYRLYDARHVTGRREELGRIVHAVGVSVLGVALVAYFCAQIVARGWLMLLFPIAGLCVVVEREVVRRAFTAMRRRGLFLRPVVIVGGGDEAVALATMMSDEPELGYRLVGVLADPLTSDPVLREHVRVLDVGAKAAEQVRLLGAGGVMIATSDVDLDTTNRLIRSLTDAGIHVELSSSLKDIDAARLSVRPLGRFPVLYVEPVKRGSWRLGAKRAFDIGMSIVALVLTAPVWIAAAIAIKVTSPGPIMFRQERVGTVGRRFMVFKLRTMYVDADARLRLLALTTEHGPVVKLRESDPRVTRPGAILRKLSIDELPQLFNVLKGEMSLVGPRPEQPAEVVQWTPDLFDRLRVKPGMTGMWQVNGRSDVTYAERYRWDLYYVDNWSIAHDLAILLKTIPVVLTSKGAY